MRDFIAFINSTANERINSFGDAGYANGYVAVPEEWELLPFDEETDDYVTDIHGGITFGSSGNNLPPLWDPDKIETVYGNFSDLDESYTVLGFDTCHWGDNLENWPRERVIEETLRLMNQIKECNDKVHKG